jgi:hypothetical protein
MTTARMWEENLKNLPTKMAIMIWLIKKNKRMRRMRVRLRLRPQLQSKNLSLKSSKKRKTKRKNSASVLNPTIISNYPSRT